MSSLLERMVQRSRGSVPGIEPLLPARYAPEGSAGQQSWRNSLAPVETTEESLVSPETPAPTLGTYLSKERLPQKEQKQTESFHPESNTRHSKVEISPRREAEPLFRRPDHVEARSSYLPVRSRIGAEALTQSVDPAKIAPTTKQASSARDAAAMELTRSKDPGNESRPVVQPLRAETLSLHTEKGPSGQRPNQPESRGEAVVEDRVSEITISIGHVEVRTEQAAAVSPRTAFRPQLSLSEFLKRRSRSAHE